MLNKIVILWFLMLGVLTELAAQDLHYSQYYYNSQNLAPSAIGRFDGDDRVTLNYRNQWLSLPVPYNTFSFLYDGQRNFKGSKSSFGMGFGLDYDRAGDSKLNMAKVVAGFSYTPYFSKKHSLTIGFLPAIAQRRLSAEGLRWDRQWNGDRYDPNLSPNENFATSGDFFLDLSAGISYAYQLAPRTSFAIHGSFFHLNRPNQTFYGINDAFVRLPIRYSLAANFNIGLFSLVDLIVGGNYQIQEKYKEVLGSARLRLRLNQTPGQILNLLAGCNVRMSDAIIPTGGIEYKNWLVSLSYDINTSFFKVATNKKGGPEIAVQYVFARVKSSGIYKKCPIY